MLVSDGMCLARKWVATLVFAMFRRQYRPALDKEENGLFFWEGMRISTEKSQEGQLWTPGNFMWILSDESDEGVTLRLVVSRWEIEGFFWTSVIFVEIFLGFVDSDVIPEFDFWNRFIDLL